MALASITLWSTSKERSYSKLLTLFNRYLAINFDFAISAESESKYLLTDFHVIKGLIFELLEILKNFQIHLTATFLTNLEEKGLT